MITLYDLAIEVTRRCNMQCDHCLRGDAQLKDISEKTIDYILNPDIEYISALVLTGGEPGLAINEINYIIKRLKQMNIGIGFFDISTNGSVDSIEFAKCLMELYTLADEKDMCSVHISNDMFHDLEKEPELLRCLKFVGNRYGKELRSDKHLILEGRAAEHWSDGRAVDPIEAVPIEENRIEDLLYVNYKGNVFASCDLSYETQEDPERKIFNVARCKDWIKAIEKYNKRVNGEK